MLFMKRLVLHQVELERAFDSSNITLKNRVFEELFTRGHISQGNNSDEIKITDIGKNYPEYLNT